MSYRHTLQAACESLHEVEDLVKGFPENENIPDIEIDLALQKLRNLYELLLIMKKSQEDTPPEPLTTEIPQAVTAPIPDIPATPPVAEAPVTPTGKNTGKHKETKTLSDQFKGKTTLYESLHQNTAREADTFIHAKPVTDVLSAIGINDRFTFIRELFNNDTAAFENTVKILNDSASFNDAYNYMIQRFNWDMDSETVQDLLGVIRRKFIKGRHE
jgi:hypothetical protein